MTQDLIAGEKHFCYRITQTLWISIFLSGIIGFIFLQLALWYTVYDLKYANEHIIFTVKHNSSFLWIILWQNPW